MSRTDSKNLIFARIVEIQNPQSLYCFPARRNLEPTSMKSTSRHWFLDEIRPSHCIEGIQGLFASAFRAQSRLQSHAGRWPVPCRFQRCIVGPQRANRLYDEDSKDRPYLRHCLWKKPAVHCKALGRGLTIGSGLSFDTPVKHAPH